MLKSLKGGWCCSSFYDYAEDEGVSNDDAFINLAEALVNRGHSEAKKLLADHLHKKCESLECFNMVEGLLLEYVEEANDDTAFIKLYENAAFQGKYEESLGYFLDAISTSTYTNQHRQESHISKLIKIMQNEPTLFDSELNAGISNYFENLQDDKKQVFHSELRNILFKLRQQHTSMEDELDARKSSISRLTRYFESIDS